MSIRTTMICALQALILTYAGFGFASWQWDPSTWPESARFTFVFTSLGIYVLNLVIKNDNSK
jgi:hypothetical protein